MAEISHKIITPAAKIFNFNHLDWQEMDYFREFSRICAPNRPVLG